MNNAYRAVRSLTSTGATEATGIIRVPTGLHRGAGIQVLGTFTATLQFEQTFDNGTTWVALTVYPYNGGAGVTSTTGTGYWKCNLSGVDHIRVRCSAYTSGTAEVNIVLTKGSHENLIGAGGASGNPAFVTGTGSAGTAASGVVTMQGISGMTPVVEVGTGDVLDVTLSLDTNAYADGDVLADTQEVASAYRVATGRLYLKTVVVLDEDDQGQALDLIFLNANTSLGTENSAPNISDSNARNIIGRVSIGSGDFYDLGGARIAVVDAAGLLMEAGSGSTSLYVAAISRGTGTYSASGIRLKLGVVWD